MVWVVGVTTSEEKAHLPERTLAHASQEDEMKEVDVPIEVYGLEEDDLRADGGGK